MDWTIGWDLDPSSTMFRRGKTKLYKRMSLYIPYIFYFI